MATQAFDQQSFTQAIESNDTVIVDGRVLMEDRRVLSVAEDAVIAAAQRECERMLERTGLSHLLAMPEDFFGHTRASGVH